MISIVICSRSAAVLSLVELSISSTIGVTYEIIAIDNSEKKYGICAAYNIGASQAMYEHLCFMHEDIKFHTTDWGKIVIDILSLPNAGVVGVAGGKYQPKAPAGWMGGSGRGFTGINVIHTTNNKTNHDYYNPWLNNLEDVATLDGLWLCCRKVVWKEFKFDSKDFPGFHFYDVDFCTRVGTKYINYLTYDVLIEHFSHGTFDKVWMENALQFYKIRKSYLPFTTEKITLTERNALNLIALQRFTYQAIYTKMPSQDILYCLKECLKQNPFNRDTLYLVKRFLALK